MDRETKQAIEALVDGALGRNERRVVLRECLRNPEWHAYYKQTLKQKEMLKLWWAARHRH